MSDVPIVELNYCAEEHFSSSYAVLNDMRRNRFLCDAKIVINDKKIFVHKNILASHSSFFKHTFIEDRLDLLEIRQNNISYDSVELLVNFIYTSQLIIDHSNVKELLVTSDYFKLNNVKYTCLKHIELSIINIENCVDLRDLAISHNIQELSDIFFAFTLKSFKNIIRCNYFLSFSFDLLKSLIKNDDLHVEETEVYESVILWLKHDKKERIKYLPELIKEIRLSNMSIDYLENIEEKEELIKSNLTCMIYLRDAYKVQLKKD